MAVSINSQLDQDDNAKLGDFGELERLTEIDELGKLRDFQESLGTRLWTYSNCQTEGWAAPEVRANGPVCQ